MRISEIAKRTGVSPKVIRSYDNMGLLPNVSRSKNGYREFTDEDVVAVLLINDLRSLGFTLREIHDLGDRYDRGWEDGPSMIDLLDENIARIDQKIAQLEAWRAYISEFRQTYIDQITFPGSTLWFLLDTYPVDESAKQAYLRMVQQGTGSRANGRPTRRRATPASRSPTSGPPAPPSGDGSGR